jgi:hypothetical protein
LSDVFGDVDNVWNKKVLGSVTTISSACTLYRAGLFCGENGNLWSSYSITKIFSHLVDNFSYTVCKISFQVFTAVSEVEELLFVSFSSVGLARSFFCALIELVSHNFYLSAKLCEAR